MTDPEVISDRERYAQAGREYSQIEPAAKLAAQWRRAKDDATGAEELLAEMGEDAELREDLEAARNPDRGARGGDTPGDGRARPQRREERDRRNPGRSRRRGGRALGRRPLQDAHQVRREPWMAGRADRGLRWQVHVRRQGRRCVLGIQVRGRNPPRAACSGDRVPGQDPHLDRHGGCAARGRRRGRADRARRPADRRLPLLRARRAVRQTRRTRPSG